MQKDIMEREIAEIIKGFRQDSIEIEMNQEHVHKWISQFSPDTQNIILEETLHILKEWYFPKDKINLFLDKMMDYLKSENENATDEEPMKDIYFWNIQESGKSQSQLVEMLNDRVNQKYGCGIRTGKLISEKYYVLCNVDTLITNLRKLIRKKKDIRQGTMQMLVTGKKRLEGFSGDWIKINLAKNSRLKARIGWQGLTTAEYLDEGYSYLITGTDFKDGRINWNGCHYVNYDRYVQDPNIQVSNGDLLLTKDGTIGKVAYISDLNRPATLNSGVFVVKPITDAYTAHFMFYVLESSVFKEFLQQLSAGSTINHLYQKDLVKFDLYVPPTTEEQEAIAGILFDMDLDIYKLEEKLSKYQKIKLGMMDELLTGKVRLV